MAKKMVKKKKIPVKKKVVKKNNKKIKGKDFPTLKLTGEHTIALDFSTKVYKKFNKIVKSIVLFGSTIKQTSTSGSDIDLLILIDDASIKWDQELIAWYRQELDKIIRTNPYKKSLHINTIKLTTWWEDLMRGDPTLMNMIRYGEEIIDIAGFFTPIKSLLLQGKIKSTPEAIYSALQRAPMHLTRSKVAELNAIEGLFWAMVDSSHAALIAANVSPSSPEHIARDLKTAFVDSGKIKMKYVVWYKDLLILHKNIMHKKIKDLKGVEIDAWQTRTEEFLNVMAKLVNELIM